MLKPKIEVFHVDLSDDDRGSHCALNFEFFRIPWRAGATTGVVGWDGDMPH